MENIDNQLKKRILVIKNETKKQLQDIAKNTINTVARNKKQSALEDLIERSKELGEILEKTSKKLVDYANKVVDDFDREISNVQNKEKYIENLTELLKEECLKSIHIAKNKAVDRFKN